MLNKSKMFSYNGKRMTTWNLFTGCNFRCSYCWARQLAEGRLKRYYPNGFVPTTHPDRFDKHFKPDEFVFPVSMGDISFAPPLVWRNVIKSVCDYPETNFLLCTKNPSIYSPYQYLPNDKLYLGTTIETNRRYNYSKAPIPYVRAVDLRNIHFPKKFLSIEPIMDFDLEFLKWIDQIAPSIVEVGADNYHNNLPEPNPDKVNALLKFLKNICPIVVEKAGLERLLK